MDYLFNYDPFWKTMEEKGMSQYVLIEKYDISTNTLNSLRHNQSVTIETLAKLCCILNCEIENVVKVVHDDK